MKMLATTTDIQAGLERLSMSGVGMEKERITQIAGPLSQNQFLSPSELVSQLPLPPSYPLALKMVGTELAICFFLGCIRFAIDVPSRSSPGPCALVRPSASSSQPSGLPNIPPSLSDTK